MVKTENVTTPKVALPGKGGVRYVIGHQGNATPDSIDSEGFGIKNGNNFEVFLRMLYSRLQ